MPLDTLISSSNLVQVFYEYIRDVRSTAFQARAYDDAIYNWPRLPEFGLWNQGPLLQGHIRGNPTKTERLVDLSGSYSFFGGPVFADPDAIINGPATFYEDATGTQKVPEEVLNIGTTTVSKKARPTDTSLTSRQIQRVVNNIQLYNVFNAFVREQMVIGYVNYSYKIAGTGGNVGEKEPSGYSTSRPQEWRTNEPYTHWYNRKHVTWLTSGRYTPRSSGINYIIEADQPTFSTGWSESFVDGHSDPTRTAKDRFGNFLTNDFLQARSFIPREVEHSQFDYDTRQTISGSPNPNYSGFAVGYNKGWFFWAAGSKGPNDQSEHYNVGNPQLRSFRSNVSNRKWIYKSASPLVTARNRFTAQPAPGKYWGKHYDYLPEVWDGYKDIGVVYREVFSDPFEAKRNAFSLQVLVDPKTGVQLGFTDRKTSGPSGVYETGLGYDPLPKSVGNRIGDTYFPGQLSGDTRGNVITRTSIETLFEVLMIKLKTNYEVNITSYERFVCHASCHSACHGSRGRR